MPEGPALTLNPDFFMYQAYAAQVNREIAFVDAGSDLTFDLETILIVFITFILRYINWYLNFTT
ncbi:hypothetical protein APW75_14315 (plasmid) [Staphylococcus aureus]|nr:hypothetical protein APW75_14315 [Staphylococcus aureus]